MSLRNIDDVLAGFEETWSPRVLARVNDWAVKVVKVEGDHVWHSHEETDEVFVVLEGELEIALDADGGEVVTLGRHDSFVVARGRMHRPRSPRGARLMLVEPAATLSTGDHEGDLPAHVDSTTGHED